MLFQKADVSGLVCDECKGNNDANLISLDLDTVSVIKEGDYFELN